jgi:hypothetical protein
VSRLLIKMLHNFLAYLSDNAQDVFVCVVLFLAFQCLIAGIIFNVL